MTLEEKILVRDLREYADDAVELRIGNSFLQAYLKNQDSPWDRCRSNRGEIFYVEVDPKKRGAGIALKLCREALELMKETGTQFVNMSPVSVGGIGVVTSMIRRGYVSAPIKTSSTGKMEFEIIPGIKSSRIIKKHKQIKR